MFYQARAQQERLDLRDKTLSPRSKTQSNTIICVTVTLQTKNFDKFLLLLY